MFEIRVNKNIVSVQETEPLISGSASVYKCRFSFDASWDGFFRSAVFRVGSMVKTIPLDNTDTCELPWELLDKKHIGLPVEVSVYGVKGETEILPTTWDKLGRVRRGSEPGEDAKEFSPSVYDRIVSLVKLYSDKSKGDKGDKGDPGEGDMTAAVYDPQGQKTDIYQYADNVLSAVPAWAMQPEKPVYTASEVGAAPAGYGYGEVPRSFVYTSDSDGTAFVNGIQSFVDGLSSGRKYLIAFQDYPYLPSVSFHGTIVRTGTRVTLEGTNYNGQAVKRIYDNSTGWFPWEWVNPPMVLGVEYRTTERYLGKPVYVKAINFGNLPAATTKTIEHGISNVDTVLVTYGQTSEHWAIPTNVYGGTSVVGLGANRVYIIAETDSDRSSATATVVIKYTKTTD